MGWGEMAGGFWQRENAIHWSNPKNTYFGPICFWLFIGAILRIHILVQYVLGLICFGSNMFWYEYVLGTICFSMNMFWSNMFPNMFWAQYVFVQYVLARHGKIQCCLVLTPASTLNNTGVMLNSVDTSDNIGYSSGHFVTTIVAP